MYIANKPTLWVARSREISNALNIELDMEDC